jgi:quinol monooxygenase YgiN
MYTTRLGQESEVRRLLECMLEPSRAEPGCIAYIAHSSPDDERVFFLYEQYTDEGAYAAHQASSHFQEFILGGAIPKLESRDRRAFLTLE